MSKPPKKTPTCPGCGSTMLRFVESEVHFGRYDCLKCGRVGPWLKSPWTLERARSFVLPIGRHKGRSVGALAGDKRGQSYLAWVAANIEGNAGIAAGIALGLTNPDGTEAQSS